MALAKTGIPVFGVHPENNPSYTYTYVHVYIHVHGTHG